MPRFILHQVLLLVLAAQVVIPSTAFARGGGGGIGHAGGGHFGGGHIGGGFRGPVGGPGFHGGFGPGYHSAAYHTAGWGYPRPYGWGYPYFGYGLGLGLGLGYGLSASYAYPAYGYGYAPYGYGYGYGSSGSSVYYGTPTSGAANTVVTTSSNSNSPEPATVGKPSPFTERGFKAFKAGDYEEAVYAWRHAVVDDSRNAVIVLELAQALLATGKYEEAAGATQAAMQQLPQDEWGAVVTRYKELYGDARDYTRQLQAMEKAIKASPNNPGLRFLAGYHYGYLGFHKQSVEQLDKAIQLESRDEMAKKLRDLMRSKLSKTDSSFTTPPAPMPETSSTWSATKP